MVDCTGAIFCVHFLINSYDGYPRKCHILQLLTLKGVRKKMSTLRKPRNSRVYFSHIFLTEYFMGSSPGYTPGVSQNRVFSILQNALCT